MSRPTFLNVPFREKDEAKSLGARWDAAQKRWYVPPDKDLEPFQRWLPDADDAGAASISPKPAAKSPASRSSSPRTSSRASNHAWPQDDQAFPRRASSTADFDQDAAFVDPALQALNLALLQASVDDSGHEGEPDLSVAGLDDGLMGDPGPALDDGIEYGKTYDDGSDFGFDDRVYGALGDDSGADRASRSTTTSVARQPMPVYQTSSESGLGAPASAARSTLPQVRSPLDHAKLARHQQPLLETLPRTDLPAPLSTAIDLPLEGKSVSLSQLLAGVSTAIARAFTDGQWTTAEVVQARLRNGHVYLELSERDPQGKVLAKANGMIWARQAQKILPQFEKATGATIGPGIKLMLKARPVFHAQFGFSLEIDAIDPDYTLGDLEARKREIRERLKRERVFDNNRALPAPWDYNLVLVVAPEGAAGLGDFQAEAQRLQACGVCRFVYVTSRFQGEGAALQIALALQTAMDGWLQQHPDLPDAVAIIRGGGAVNDLAWLNDYTLARLICDLPVPVLTGIGHERDNTVLDEVAHTRFDTPSKVIAGIEQLIRKRTDEAKQHFESIVQRASQGLKRSAAQIEQLNAQSQSLAQRQLALARDRSAQHWHSITQGAQHTLHRAAQQTDQTFSAVRHDATRHWADARQHVPVLMTTITNQARAALSRAQHQTALWQASIVDHGRAQVAQAKMGADQLLQSTQEHARSHLHDAGRRAQALMLEITGQGPAKTLARGFVLARDAHGHTVTRAAQAQQAQSLVLEFGDGQVPVSLPTAVVSEPPAATQPHAEQPQKAAKKHAKKQATKPSIEQPQNRPDDRPDVGPDGRHVNRPNNRPNKRSDTLAESPEAASHASVQPGPDAAPAPLQPGLFD